MQYEIGKSYEVTCAELRWKEDDQVYLVPVVDFPHTDQAFDFPYRHYHIDGRFEIHPRIKHRLQISDGYTSTILLTEGTSIYDFRGILLKSVLYERVETGLAVPRQYEKYMRWYQGYLGQSCINKKCPHLGINLIEFNGHLVCPLHGLTADAKTLKIIQVSV